MQTLTAICALAGLLTVASAAPSPVSTTAPGASLAKRKPAPEGDTQVNITLDAQVWPPPGNGSVASGIFDQDIPENFKVLCKGCFVRGTFIFSAGDEGVLGDWTPSENFTNAFVNKTNFNFEDHWVGVSMRDFSAHIELEVDITPTNTSNELSVHMLGKPVVIAIPLLPGLDIIFDPQLHGWVNVSKELSFTYGMDIEVPDGSTPLLAALHPDRNVAPGFNETKVTPLPFQSNVDDIELDLEIAFRPHFELEVPVAGRRITFGVEADLPKFGVHVSQVHNADAKCTVPGNVTAASNTTSASSDLLFPQLTKLEPYVGMALTLSVETLAYTPLDFEHPLQNALPVNCLEYDPKGKVLVAPGSLEADNGSKNAAHPRGKSSVLLVILSLSAGLFI
ncbi:hypothetical protein EXIGLDRAFT_727021 [Exidia glandulosa HHB12029]|uniref:Acid protease n=1 Tax=Exidia glandulosa HHB12029 TaxID=1314781 RepID=A0A165DHC1_EXIGL|nr:hypothetical protein EXIGLDRAFT_727021 [Exidia glandulosa HHB12029]